MVGLVGFVIGILVGILVLKRGFSLRRAYQQSMTEGLILPASMVGLLVLALAAPSFIISSVSGPGSQHAPILLALGGGPGGGHPCPALPPVHGGRHP